MAVEDSIFVSATEKNLYEQLLQKWQVNRTFMGPGEFERFIDFKFRQEEFQQDLIDRLELFERLPGKRVLDIGCGEGGLPVALIRHGCKVRGVDIKPENLGISQLRAHRHQIPPEVFLRADAAHLPFAAASFDVVIMNEVLEHVPQLGATLRQASRVLKQGGVFFARVPNAAWPFEGHVNLWFPHWLPKSVRRAYVRTFRREKGRESNYLDEIRYLGSAGWLRAIRPYFQQILSTQLVYQKICSGKKGWWGKGLKLIMTQRPFSTMMALLAPTIYLIARK
jgi:2-polyprenyl-3-methyl-5-hydroxy-6-metoxy-1,4-benzoquinol methylase